MSTYADRLKDAADHVKDAGDELRAMDDRAQYEGPALDRLESVIAYAAMVLKRTDAELASAQVVTEVRDAGRNIANGPAVAADNADAYADALLVAVQRLPVAVGRDLEQHVKDAAATFQRSAAQRLNSLESDITKAEATVEELGTRIDGAKTDAEADLQALREEIATQKQALDALVQSHTDTFTASQEERDTEFDERVGALEKSANERVDALVTEIERMERESAELVGAIGLAGTAERYGEEVVDQGKYANRWRYITVALAIAAVLAAGFAAVRPEKTAEGISGKLAVSVILAGIAAYAARQSAYHRHREADARALQLELTAFAPFIEPLQPEQREEERVIMTRKTFGKTTVKQAAEEEPGPTALSLLMRRKQKQLEAGDPDEV